MAKPASGGIVAVRSNSSFLTNPLVTGFSNLVDPDVYEGEASFKLNVHATPEQATRLGVLLDKHVIDALWEEFLKVAAEKGKDVKKLVKPSGQEWVEDHLKEANERSKNQNPFLVFKNKADYQDAKTGKIVRKSMKAYDGTGTMIDLEALKLGMGSTVQVVLTPGLFMNALIKQPTPSLKLQGVRVLKLQQFGAGGGAAIEEVTEEDLALLGSDFQADDLSGFVAKPKDNLVAGLAELGKQATKSRARSEFEDDLEDEIPF